MKRNYLQEINQCIRRAQQFKEPWKSQKEITADFSLYTKEAADIPLEELLDSGLCYWNAVKIHKQLGLNVFAGLFFDSIEGLESEIDSCMGNGR